MFIFRSVSPTDVLLYLKTKLWNLCINSMSLFAFTDPRISHSHLRSITLNTVILSELHSTVKAGVTGEPCGIRHWTCRHSHSSGSFTVKQCSVGTTRRKTDYWQLNRWQCSCCFPKMPMNRWKVRAALLHLTRWSQKWQSDVVDSNAQSCLTFHQQKNLSKVNKNICNKTLPTIITTFTVYIHF